MTVDVLGIHYTCEINVHILHTHVNDVMCCWKSHGVSSNSRAPCPKGSSHPDAGYQVSNLGFRG